MFYIYDQPTETNYLFTYQNLSNPDLFIEEKLKTVWYFLSQFLSITLPLLINRHHHFPLQEQDLLP